MKTIHEILIFSKYHLKANCIAKVLTHLGIRTITDLDNLPRFLSKVCGEDVYQLVEELRQTWKSTQNLT